MDFSLRMRITLQALALVRAEDSSWLSALAVFCTLTAEIRAAYLWSCEEPEHSPASPGRTRSDRPLTALGENLLFFGIFNSEMYQKTPQLLRS